MKRLETFYRTTLTAIFTLIATHAWAIDDPRSAGIAQRFLDIFTSATAFVLYGVIMAGLGVGYMLRKIEWEWFMRFMVGMLIVTGSASIAAWFR